ncbi:MAG: winged helix-turn-helix transcriptional regulator [Bacteroidetes bacterium]|nr:winged helix-turn-helix transcriptional regulator [Bacteroidota bacterium]
MKSSFIDPSKLEVAAGKLKAISHPMRIAMIELLNQNKKLTVTEIYQRLKIEQASASHHLNILKNKGLVVSKRDGKKIYYSLKGKSLNGLIESINRCTAE